MGISPISTKIMHSVVELKEENVQKEVDSLWKGRNFVRETIYRVGDAGTAGFALFQSVALFVSTAGTILAGSITGVVGGILTIGQGVLLLPDALQSLLNGQGKQGLTQLWDSVFLILTGAVMTLISLAAATTLLSGIAGITAFLSNPYALATLFLLSSFIGFANVIRLQRNDTASQLLERLENPESLKEYLQEIVPFKPEGQNDSLAIAKWHIKLMEQLAQDMGVKATLPMMKLIEATLKNEETASYREQVDAELAAWNHALRLRFASNFLYILSCPLGAIAAAFRTATKVATLVSNICLVGGGSTATKLDSYPFARGSSVTPKAPTPQAVINHGALIFS